jgi:hypothetical protein
MELLAGNLAGAQKPDHQLPLRRQIVVRATRYRRVGDRDLTSRMP